MNRSADKSADGSTHLSDNIAWSVPVLQRLDMVCWQDGRLCVLQVLAHARGSGVAAAAGRGGGISAAAGLQRAAVTATPSAPHLPLRTPPA